MLYKDSIILRPKIDKTNKRCPRLRKFNECPGARTLYMGVPPPPGVSYSGYRNQLATNKLTYHSYQLFQLLMPTLKHFEIPEQEVLL